MEVGIKVFKQSIAWCRFGDQTLRHSSDWVNRKPFFSLISHRDGKVYPGEGSTAVTVQFRLVVFRPFDGEILLGTVKDSIPEGLIVSMGFFDHVFIPSGSMQADSDLYVTTNLPAHF